MKDRFCKYSSKAFTPLVLLLFFSVQFPVYSQTFAAADILTPPESGYRCRALVIEGDTYPLVVLNNVDISTDFVFKSARQREQ